jgi:DNA-directed RNA polymerase subunit RPC12/RpoP
MIFLAVWEKDMYAPIKFVCSTCGNPIAELNAKPHQMFGSAGSYCTRCSHLISKDEIISQVEAYCLHRFSKTFHKKVRQPEMNPASR